MRHGAQSSTLSIDERKVVGLHGDLAPPVQPFAPGRSIDVAQSPQAPVGFTRPRVEVERATAWCRLPMVLKKWALEDQNAARDRMR